MKITELKSRDERVAYLKKVVEPFRERAEEHDRNITFPFENFSDLKKIGYPTLTLPTAYGGGGISLHEMLELQMIISEADGSTGLSVGWHMGLMKYLGEKNPWISDRFSDVAKNVTEHGALLNNAATEPATGSPTRGGKPETYAKETKDGWKLNGRKTFTTLAPILDYFVVRASIDGTEDVADFLVEREKTGVRVEETWDSIAMRASGSHDLVLQDVELEKDDLVNYSKPTKKPAGWLLHIPACYLGIAKAAQHYANDFARTYSPNSMDASKTISDFPNVQQKMGEMELLRLEAEHFLFSVARKWDEADEDTRNTMGPELGAVKLSVVNKAVEIVDIAMRINGARSLSEKNPLQRYYRDVRAGLHNPPMDDMTIINLAKSH